MSENWIFCFPKFTYTSNAFNFVSHKLYLRHPPKNEDHKLPSDLPDISNGIQAYNSELKTILRKAIIHYHPDRCNVEKHGKKWKVLCEEICKMLTRRYESFKWENRMIMKYWIRKRHSFLCTAFISSLKFQFFIQGRNIDKYINISLQFACWLNKWKICPIYDLYQAKELR